MTTPTPGANRRWSDAETSALVSAWGQLYLRRNRGSLRMEDWVAVCSAVNAHGGDAKRSIAQCQTRVQTLKARYKEEVAKGRPTSGWRHFDRLHVFLADPIPLPPGYPAKTPPEAPVKKEKRVEETSVQTLKLKAQYKEEAPVKKDKGVEETSGRGCVGGSAGGGRTKVPAKRHYSSLEDILKRSGGPSLAKTPATVKEEEVVGCGCELVGGPVAEAAKLVAEMRKLAEVYAHAEWERFMFEKEMRKVKKEVMETDNSEEADGN